MRVLVIGGSGFVGGHFLAWGKKQGDEVHATYRPGERFDESAAAQWHAVDLLESGSLDAAVADGRPDAILHLAGQADVAQANRDPVGTFRINAEGVLRVLETTRRLAPDAAVAVVTSAEVYGAVPAAEMPVREDRPLEPRTPYGASKASADLIAYQAAAGWGMRVMRMRPFNHLGPGQRLGFVAPDFAAQVAAIERGFAPPVLKVGDVSGRRDFTDVRDIVRGYRSALEKGVPGAAYNLGSGRSMAISEILDYFVGSSTADIEIRVDPAKLRPVEVPEFRAHTARAEHELGWRPTISLQASLADVLQEWRNAPDEALPHPDRPSSGAPAGRSD